ncbi:MAG: hypothetical protein Q4D82_04965 [Neisseria sp.]|nr:hypothetical protein [Neisseria sp.]
MAGQTKARNHTRKGKFRVSRKTPVKGRLKTPAFSDGLFDNVKNPFYTLQKPLFNNRKKSRRLSKPPENPFSIDFSYNKTPKNSPKNTLPKSIK